MNDFIILDTDILIDVGRKIKEAIDRLEKEEKDSILGTTIITQMELIVGCRNKKELSALNRFLSRFKIFTMNEKTANKALELLECYRLSHGLLIADSLIAAIAITMDIPLLSKNQKDYRFIKGLKLLPYP